MVSSSSDTANTLVPGTGSCRSLQRPSGVCLSADSDSFSARRGVLSRSWLTKIGDDQSHALPHDLRERVRPRLGVQRPARGSTTPHVHPNSVMVTLSDFQRRLRTDEGVREVDTPQTARCGCLPSGTRARTSVGPRRTPSSSNSKETQRVSSTAVSWGRAPEPAPRHPR